MTKHVVTETRSEIRINTFKDDWLFKADTKMGDPYHGGSGAGIHITGERNNITFNGIVYNELYAIQIDGRDTTLKIGASAEVYGYIYSPTQTLSMTNRGTLNDGYQYLLEGPTQYPCKLIGSGFADRLDNYGTVNIEILLGDGKDSLTNEGVINDAVNLGANKDGVSNSGTFSGSVNLGEGNDVFVHTDGFVGQLYGGTGDDTLTTKDGSVLLLENDGEGFDTVRASDDYILSVNVEKLVLTGKKDLEGRGSVGNEILVGNAGDNILGGGGGLDTITGGKGDDHFVFTHDDAQYTITDFEDKHDKIEIVGWSTIKNYADLKDRIFQEGDDVWVGVLPAGGRHILLEDTKLSQINARDFVFW